MFWGCSIMFRRRLVYPSGRENMFDSISYSVFCCMLIYFFISRRIAMVMQ